MGSPEKNGNIGYTRHRVKNLNTCVRPSTYNLSVFDSSRCLDI